MKRKLGLFLMFGAVLPLVVASAAWACGVLATLSLDTKSATTDQAVAFKGKNYSTSSTASSVTIRLSTRAGKQVATTTPVPGGNIEGTFSTKGISPGWYVVSATQSVTTPDMRIVPKSGTPGRTTLRIGSPSAAAAGNQAAAISPWSSAKPTGPAASAAPVARDGGPAPLPMLLAMALSLMLLAAGAKLVARRNHTTSRLPLGA